MTQLSRSGGVRSLLAMVTVAFVVVAACGDDKNAPKTGSNSNWLVACIEEYECGEVGACVCGACSRECGADGDCAGLPNARCSPGDQLATSTQCGAVLGGLCLPICTPGSCAAGQHCMDGFCVLAELPDTEFCAPVSSGDSESQAKEDALLTLIQQNRVAGSIACEGGPNIESAPALSLDGRLTCAARVRALDQARSGVSGPLDSLGRSAPERLALSGYQQSSWWESYAFDVASANEAYALLMQDTDSCPELGSSAYSAVGVGTAGDVFVVTLASE